MKTILAKILIFFKIFPQKKDESWSSIEKDLANLKAHLYFLLKDDHSQDLKFFQKFSKIWKEIIEKEKVLKHPALKIKYLNDLVLSIEAYPKKQEFSLNYYLIENTKENILPYPLSEMLQTLHLNKAKIQAWINLIEKILKH